MLFHLTLPPIKAHSDECSLDARQDGGMAQLLRDVLCPQIRLFEAIMEASMQTSRLGERWLSTGPTSAGGNAFLSIRSISRRTCVEGISSRALGPGPC